MLKSIDVLIGLSVVMLVGSLATMLITQALMSVAHSRGRYLFSGLADLIAQLHPATSRAHAEAIATAVLSHPLIRVSRSRLGTCVKREELLKLLMELSDPAAMPAGTNTLDQAGLDALKEILRQNGIADPTGTLKNVRMLALQLERTFPEMGTSARHALALTQEANSELVAKVSAWFDQTMDRVTERFTAHSHMLTAGAALFVALVTQLDTLQLVNRLALDDKMRAALVSEALTIDAGQNAERSQQVQQGQAARGPSDPQPPDQQPEVSPTVDKGQNPAPATDEQRVMHLMTETGIVHIPATFGEWWQGLAHANPGGVLLSFALMSLGAPFWFNILGSLLRLRSLVAQKDDTDRLSRQTDGLGGAGAGTGGSGPRPPDQPRAITGERGDLAAVG